MTRSSSFAARHSVEAIKLLPTDVVPSTAKARFCIDVRYLQLPMFHSSPPSSSAFSPCGPSKISNRYITVVFQQLYIGRFPLHYWKAVFVRVCIPHTAAIIFVSRRVFVIIRVSALCVVCAWCASTLLLYVYIPVHMIRNRMYVKRIRIPYTALPLSTIEAL